MRLLASSSSVTTFGWFLFVVFEKCFSIFPRENLDFVSQRSLLTYKIFFSFPRMSCIISRLHIQTFDTLRLFQYSVFNVQCTDEFECMLKVCFHKCFQIYLYSVLARDRATSLRGALYLAH